MNASGLPQYLSFEEALAAGTAVARFSVGTDPDWRVLDEHPELHLPDLRHAAAARLVASPAPVRRRVIAVRSVVWEEAIRSMPWDEYDRPDAVLDDVQQFDRAALVAEWRHLCAVARISPLLQDRADAFRRRMTALVGDCFGDD